MGEKERCRAQVPSTADLPDERLREVYELSILGCLTLLFNIISQESFI